jgi:hypothetical protein
MPPKKKKAVITTKTTGKSRQNPKIEHKISKNNINSTKEPHSIPVSPDGRKDRKTNLLF